MIIGCVDNIENSSLTPHLTEDQIKGMQDREAAGFERAFSAHASRKIAEKHTSIPAIFHFT